MQNSFNGPAGLVGGTMAVALLQCQWQGKCDSEHTSGAQHRIVLTLCDYVSWSSAELLQALLCPAGCDVQQCIESRKDCVAFLTDTPGPCQQWLGDREGDRDSLVLIISKSA